MRRPENCVDSANDRHDCGRSCYVEIISRGPPDRSLGEILRDPPKLSLKTPHHKKEETMTQVQYETEIERLEIAIKLLEAERRVLTNLAFDIHKLCPRSEPDKRTAHDWTVIRADSLVVFGGDDVRSADFECIGCGATMSICDAQYKVGGG